MGQPGCHKNKPASVNFGTKTNLTDDFHKLLASPNICSKKWVYEQYDSMVQTNTVEGPGLEAGVIRVKGTNRGLAMALDGNSRWCYLNPRLGAMHAVAEACRNVACSGAKPLAATNCLNFGNPEKPPIMQQFSETIDGITEACEKLATPITGGNVSFYNETLGEGIYPTPVMGIVGILEDVHKAVQPNYRSAGKTLVLISGAPEQSQGDAEKPASVPANTPKSCSNPSGANRPRSTSTRKPRSTKPWPNWPTPSCSTPPKTSPKAASPPPSPSRFCPQSRCNR